MRTTLTIIAGMVLFCLFLPIQAKAPVGQPDEDPNIRPPVEQPAPKPRQTRQWAPPDVQPYKDELRAIAEAKGLPEGKIREIEGVIACESSWNPKAAGDSNTSHGLAQIHLPANPNVTRQQAEDVRFALNFIVDKFIDGDEWMWTCYRILYD